MPFLTGPFMDARMYTSMDLRMPPTIVATHRPPLPPQARLPAAQLRTIAYTYQQIPYAAAIPRIEEDVLLET
jgi:hypothetical protein